MIGGEGNTRTIFTYAHDYQRSLCKGINPVPGAGSISANTVEPASYIAVIHEMSVSLQHKAPICRRYSPPPCERDISIDWKRSRAGRRQPFRDPALKTTAFFPRLTSRADRGWIQRADLQVFLDL